MVAELTRNDLILCLISSQTANDSYTTLIEDDNFETGGLSKTSYVKSNRVFTANEQIIACKAGTLTPKNNEVIDKLIAILQQ
ncbi:type II toxin-antitoxin system PemK/MazF family toxin [Gloeocapsa sp. PCC 7428]|uniref:type II toxin-antitoxin system PemK/MazF family toxin n=1 Tax=Gloeocapsa sp. PCC 7428 TaxID=1173026 RepID=UPI00030EB2A0|nr:type II toxin-antitoxin system PemK/MazF family toxin [Gloeocapsa sp. PCC 7428]